MKIVNVFGNQTLLDIRLETTSMDYTWSAALMVFCNLSTSGNVSEQKTHLYYRFTNLKLVLIKFITK